MTRNVLLAAPGLLALSPALAQPLPDGDPGVTVEGTNLNGIVFTWEVTNRTSTAINYFRIPVYNINTFTAPKGWQMLSQPRLTSGDFILQTDDYPAMILTNRTLTFECRRPLSDVPLDGRVTAIVGFEDGTRMEIPGVLAPVKRSVLENLLLPIFLAALLGLFFLIKTLKDRKSAGSGSGGPTQRPPSPGDEPQTPSPGTES